MIRLGLCYAQRTSYEIDSIEDWDWAEYLIQRNHERKVLITGAEVSSALISQSLLIEGYQVRSLDAFLLLQSWGWLICAEIK